MIDLANMKVTMMKTINEPVLVISIDRSQNRTKRNPSILSPMIIRLLLIPIF